jgi:hypothetical protein
MAVRLAQMARMKIASLATLRSSTLSCGALLGGRDSFHYIGKKVFIRASELLFAHPLHSGTECAQLEFMRLICLHARLEFDERPQVARDDR